MACLKLRREEMHASRSEPNLGCPRRHVVTERPAATGGGDPLKDVTHLDEYSVC